MLWKKLWKLYVSDTTQSAFHNQGYRFIKNSIETWIFNYNQLLPIQSMKLCVYEFSQSYLSRLFCREKNYKIIKNSSQQKAKLDVKWGRKARLTLPLSVCVRLWNRKIVYEGEKLLNFLANLILMFFLVLYEKHNSFILLCIYVGYYFCPV